MVVEEIERQSAEIGKKDKARRKEGASERIRQATRTPPHRAAPGLRDRIGRCGAVRGREGHGIASSRGGGLDLQTCGSEAHVA